MAGSFGYECEHYELSRTVGERKLLPAVRDASPATVVVASGFSCRHQIQHFTGTPATHPAVILQSLLGNNDLA
jgi:Fe-S oxidoreductase